MKIVSNSNVSTKLCGMIIAAAVLGGCASAPPPNDVVLVAETAIKDAAAAGATELAPAELQSARENLAEARKAWDEKDNKKAKWLAERAEADARLAERKARTAKAEKASQAIQDDIRVLREEMNRK